MAIGIAIGVLTAAVPFLFSKLNTRGGSGGGLFRTFTTREGAAVPVPPPLARNDDPPMFTEEEIFGPAPIAAKPVPTPSAPQQAAKLPPMPGPVPMPPAPPPMTPAAPMELPPLVAPSDPVSSSRPWDGPGQTQLPTAQEIEALPAPPMPPPPPPFPGDPVTPVSVTPSVTRPAPVELPPQERGELPPELSALPATMPTPAASTPLATPPAGYDPVKARAMAKQVASNITNKSYSYSRDQVEQFQRFAGIDVDGNYGGETRGALEFYGVRRPPRALFKPTETVPYKWASWAA